MGAKPLRPAPNLDHTWATRAAKEGNPFLLRDAGGWTNMQTELVWRQATVYLDHCCLGVLVGVSQRLLHNAVKMLLDLNRIPLANTRYLSTDGRISP